MKSSFTLPQFSYLHFQNLRNFKSFFSKTVWQMKRLWTQTQKFSANVNNSIIRLPSCEVLLEPQCHKAWLFRLINQYQLRSVRDPSPKIIQKYDKFKTTNNYEFWLSVDPGFLFFFLGGGGCPLQSKRISYHFLLHLCDFSPWLHWILFIP
jgi:hypothetical protein